MSIRTLSLTLNLDTGQFTANARQASAVTKELSAQLDLVGRRARASASDLDGSVRSLRNYVENGLRLKQTQEQIRASQDQFVKGLLRELDTMGMNSAQLKAYTAAQLGLTAQTRDLLAALDEKAASLRAVAQAEEAEAMAMREAAMAEATRLEQSEALLNTMREQIVTLRGGTQALAMEKAEALGCAEEYRALSAAVAKLNAEHVEAAATMRAFALTEEEAGEAGEVAARGARSHGRAIYELNVLTHELSSGRIRQAISSFSILLSNIGLAAQATLGLTLTIGILYGLSKPIEEAAKHMEDLKLQAQELGVSTNFLQTLGLASDLLGIKTEKLVAGFGRLDQAFARARAGSKQAQDGFNALGVDLQKNYTNQELVQTVLKGWNKIPDGPRKAAVAMEVFGRSGKDLIPVLDKLAGHYDDLDAKAEQYGLHNQDAIKVGAELTEQFRDDAAAMKGLGMAILADIGPALISFMKGMSGVAQSLGNFLRDKDRVAQAGRELKAVFIGIGAALIANAIPAIIAMIGSIGAMIANVYLLIEGMGLLDFAMMATPWGAVAVAIGLVVGSLYLLHPQVKASADAQKALNDANEEGATLEARMALATEKQRQAIFDATKEKYKEAEANLAVAASLLKQAQAQDDANDAAAARAGGTYFDDSKTKEAQAEYDRRKKARDKEFENLGKAFDGLNAPKGTTLDDPTQVKANPAVTALSDLKAQAASLQGKLTDTGSEYAKWVERLSNSEDPISKAAKAHKGLAAAILEAAKNVDRLNTEVKQKDAYGALAKQATEAKDRALQAKQALEAALSGHDADSRRKIARNAAIDSKVAAAGGTQAAYVAGDQEKSADDQADNNESDVKNLDDWQKKLTDANNTANELWTNYNLGIGKAQNATAKLRAELDDAIAKAKDPRVQEQLRNIGDKLIPATASAEGEKAADEMRNKTKQINAELAGDSIAKQREVAQQEAKFYAERIAGMDHTTEAWKNAYADYIAYVDASNRKLAAETPWGKMAKDWGDLTDNMQKQSAQWMNSFVTDLSKGKLNFGQFTQSILQDMSEMIMKALIANTIIKPLMQAMGLNMDSGGTSITGFSGSGFLSSLGNMFGMGGDAGAAGGMDAATMLVHGGGMAGFGGMTRNIDPGAFFGAPRYHTGGIAGLRPDEVPAILQRGEGVFTQQQMKDMARGGQNSGAPPVSINLNNQSGVPLDADHAGTKFDGEKYVLDVVVSHLSRPGALRNAIKSQQ